MTVMIETAAAGPTRKHRAAAKKAETKKAASKKKPEKVKGIHTLPSGKFEVSIFLGGDFRFVVHSYSYARRGPLPLLERAVRVSLTRREDRVRG